METIETIKSKLDVLADAHGVAKSSIICEIFNMLNALKVELAKEREDHEKEVAELREILDAPAKAVEE